MFSVQVSEKDGIQENIFSLLLDKRNHTPTIPNSKVITTAKRNGMAIPTIGNSTHKGKRCNMGYFRHSIQLYGTTMDNQFREY